MIRRRPAPLEQPHAPPRIACRRSHNSCEIRHRNMVRAGAGHENAARTKHSKRSQVQLLVAAQSPLNGALRFGEGWRIENDRVVHGSGIAPIAQQVKGVGLDPIYLRVIQRVAVGLEVALGNFERGARHVDSGHSWA